MKSLRWLIASNIRVRNTVAVAVHMSSVGFHVISLTAVAAVPKSISGRPRSSVKKPIECRI